eukprot:1141701-Pelagomonas_calceolata.AAC.4
MQDASSTSAKAKKGAKPGSVSPAPHDLAAREDGEDAQLAPEFSGIKSLLVRVGVNKRIEGVQTCGGGFCIAEHTELLMLGNVQQLRVHCTIRRWRVVDTEVPLRWEMGVGGGRWERSQTLMISQGPKLTQIKPR